MVSDIAKNNPSERRRYFRIKDEILLFYKQLDSDDIPADGSFKEKTVDSFSLTAALSHLSEDTRVQLKLLDKNYPDVAGYLKILDRKINMIAQAVLLNDSTMEGQSSREVDLSASGLAFASEKAIKPESVLELKMILPPSLMVIITYGKVVHCRYNAESENEQFPYSIGVDFLSLDENDRELLIRHIVKRQMVQLKKRNNPA